jgi:Xaa-Pro aminopeptidase
LTEALMAWRAELARADDGLEDVPAPPSRLAALRAELKRRDLSGFVVPRADEHQGEYVPRRSQRLAWLTGFSGSAGLAIVLADRAAIFIDGRYTLAVRAQVDTDAFVPHQIPNNRRRHGSPRTCPKAASSASIPGCRRSTATIASPAPARRAGGRFVPVDSNPIDAVWPDRPPAPSHRCCRSPTPSPARTARPSARASRLR